MRLCPHCSGVIDTPWSIDQEKVYTVLADVERATAVLPSAMLGHNKSARVHEARVAAALVLKERYGLSTVELADVFGGRDVSTVGRWFNVVPGDAQELADRLLAAGVQQVLS